MLNITIIYLCCGEFAHSVTFSMPVYDYELLIMKEKHDTLIMKRINIKKKFIINLSKNKAGFLNGNLIIPKKLNIFLQLGSGITI